MAALELVISRPALPGFEGPSTRHSHYPSAPASQMENLKQKKTLANVIFSTTNNSRCKEWVGKKQTHMREQTGEEGEKQRKEWSTKQV